MAQVKQVIDRFRPLVVYVVIVLAGAGVLTLANHHTNSVSDAKTCQSLKKSRADTDLIFIKIVDHFTVPGHAPSPGVAYIKSLIEHRDPIQC